MRCCYSVDMYMMHRDKQGRDNFLMEIKYDDSYKFGRKYKWRIEHGHHLDKLRYPDQDDNAHDYAQKNYKNGTSIF